MAKFVLFDQFHVDLLVLKRISELKSRKIRRTLNQRPFQGDLRNAINDVFRKHIALATVRIAISR